MAMAQEPRQYHAYLLRLWWVNHNGQAGWRASLEEPHTGVRHGFATLEQLFAFIKQQTDSGAENTAEPDRTA
jgi:hypothetical protein